MIPIAIRSWGMIAWGGRTVQDVTGEGQIGYWDNDNKEYRAHEQKVARGFSLSLRSYEWGHQIAFHVTQSESTIDLEPPGPATKTVRKPRPYNSMCRSGLAVEDERSVWVRTVYWSEISLQLLTMCNCSKYRGLRIQIREVLHMWVTVLTRDPVSLSKSIWHSDDKIKPIADERRLRHPCL